MAASRRPIGQAGPVWTVGAIVVSFFYFFPVLWIILTAFKTYSDALAVPLEGFDFIWASPPCQAYTKAQRLQKREHPDLIAPIRKRLVTPEPGIFPTCWGLTGRACMRA